MISGDGGSECRLCPIRSPCQADPIRAVSASSPPFSDACVSASPGGGAACTSGSPRSRRPSGRSRIRAHAVQRHPAYRVDGDHRLGDLPGACARCTARRARSRCNTGHPRAWSIARSPIRTLSRAREPLWRPIRRTSRASSTSAWPSPVRGSFAKPSRRSREGSRSSRRTRCFCDGAGIDIFPS